MHLIRLRLNKRHGKGHGHFFLNEKLTLMLDEYVDNIIRAWYLDIFVEFIRPHL